MTSTLDEDDLAAFAQQSGSDISEAVFALRRMPLVECNDLCRHMAAQLREQLGPHLNEWEENFCHSITMWTDERHLSFKQIKCLLYAQRHAALRAIAAERRAHRYMVDVVPANTLPA
jgi:hypothetical protein